MKLVVLQSPLKQINAKNAHQNYDVKKTLFSDPPAVDLLLISLSIYLNYSAIQYSNFTYNVLISSS